ncbi:SH3 domain-containing protein [Herminiimonas sp.]|uniref:SH3 domain-containing protein n=1 Tax=Herminiimonas sp. TaxID=1926289 RepID=UPI002728B931|nr:SH3 domain-containing protein [Herminiimonas sp.]MDO8306673.1 SH3 domain-containing protein [Herminiimonas sp.]
MKCSSPIFAALLFATLGMSALHAAEYKSVGAQPAVLYNAPSDKGRKIFVAPRGMPVEVVLTQGGWSKVRDAAGDLFWIETTALAVKRNVIVTAANIKLHATAEEAAAVLAMADKGVLLELLAPAASGWVKLKHRDGPTGFAKVTEVWGE